MYCTNGYGNILFICLPPNLQYKVPNAFGILALTMGHWYPQDADILPFMRLYITYFVFHRIIMRETIKKTGPKKV